MVKKQKGGCGKRSKAKERKWRGILDEQGQSGASIRGFCRERGLREAAFYWWRREIERRDREREASASPSLAPVVMVEEASCWDKAKAPEKSSAIELVLCGGTVVRVPGGATREQLGMVLDVLERSRC